MVIPELFFFIILSMDWFSRENLNRKPWFLPSNIGLSCKFSHHPFFNDSAGPVLVDSSGVWTVGRATFPERLLCRPAR